MYRGRRAGRLKDLVRENNVPESRRATSPSLFAFLSPAASPLLRVGADRTIQCSRMSLAAESPLQSSSSSEDFAALLDAELELASSDTSPNEEEAENDDENDLQEPRTKRRKVEDFESLEDIETPMMVETNQEHIERSYAMEIVKLLDPGKVYFDSKVLGPDSSSRDVRQVLKGIRHEILQGCKIIFDDRRLSSNALFHSNLCVLD
ncbi:RNA polymerase II C-terminal domain phosphatase-like [Musa troglodytarum]|uniref:RNA polymerase II C-terminal domain phosphatase-like n=1 Tax=Musa troglodytarum TaxID=320322 RepID=A0A9E7GNF2_9LILI|nr:RNA polymerase II C-terminal domain phosphatase-like [Musa troglodytarum]